MTVPNAPRVGGETPAHEAGDSGVTLEAAHVPVKPRDDFARRRLRAQHVRSGLLRLGAEALHGSLQKRLVALLPRLRRKLDDVAAVGREPERHVGGQRVDGGRGRARVQAHAADEDADLRRAARSLAEVTSGRP